MTKPMFRRPAVFAPFAHLIAAESTRHGGVSPTPLHTLNLGRSAGDTIENVYENRRRFFGALGIEVAAVALSHQVHGDSILLAEQPGHYEGHDAIVTNRADLFVAVSVADCTPILIYDARTQAVAAIHAGWRGTVKEIVRKTCEYMSVSFGTQAADCYAYVGTCIDECSFEVGPEVAEAFDGAFKRFDPTKQKYFVNLKAANVAQLERFGVPAAQIEVSPYSTVLHNEDYFSYRFEQARTGRMMAVIGRKN